MKKLPDISWTMLLLYNLHMDGVPNDPEVLSAISTPSVNSQVIRPEDMPHHGVDFEDVIAPESIEEAGLLMREMQDRIFAFSSHAQTAAMNAGNYELAEAIAERWTEFSQRMEGNKTFHSYDTFVMGARDAMEAYKDVIGDIHRMLLEDPNSMHELRYDSEGMASLGRARAGVAFYVNNQMDSLIDAVEVDLQNAGLVRDANLTTAPATGFNI